MTTLNPAEPSRAAGGPGSAAHQPCVHWWVLPTPQGETSLGVCKFCHEEREFPNGFVGITISDHKGGAEFMAPIEPSGIARYIP